MIEKIHKFFKDMKEIWDVAKKPDEKELKRTIYTTLLLFFIIALISLAIFITIQYALYLWGFT